MAPSRLPRPRWPPPLETPAALASRLEGSLNPGTGHVQPRYALAQTETCTLTVYDEQGRLVAALAGGTGSADQAQQVPWQVGRYAAGLYLVRLQTPTVKQLKFVKQ